MCGVSKSDGTDALQEATDIGKVVWEVTSQTMPTSTSHESLVFRIVTIWLAIISTVSCEENRI